MVLNPDHPKCYARIQRKPEGRCRSCVVGISAELVENLDSSTKPLNFDLTAAIEIEKAHHRKGWHQKLLARFWGMACAALWWVLRKLLLDLIIDEIK